MSCEYVYPRGKRAGKRCEVVPRQGTRCNRHRETGKPKNINVKDDPVFAEPAAAEPASVVKSRSSIWSMTINSNQVFEKMSVEEKTKFKKFIEYITLKNNFFNFITDKSSPDDSTKNIRSFETDYEFEAGTVTGCLHAHILIRVTHNGYLVLRLNDIRALAFKIFKRNLHIHAPVSSDQTSAWSAYLAKTRNKVKL